MNHPELAVSLPAACRVSAGEVSSPFCREILRPLDRLLAARYLSPFGVHPVIFLQPLWQEGRWEGNAGYL